MTLCVSACGTTGKNAKLDPAPNGVVGNTLCLNASNAGESDTYRRIESVFGTGAVESPSDTQYTPPRPHVMQREGDGIVGPHFAILAIAPTDVNQDLVTLQNGGARSRTEIKIAPSKGGMHDAFKARDGDTFVYAWRFKIAPEMKFSPGFTHIHQIKAYGGVFSDPPMITFTPLANGKMEVRHVGDTRKDASTSATLGSMSLDGIRGQWLDVREEITYSNTAGRYQLTVRDQAGGVVLAINAAGLETWRTGADHMRPKWGIYRRHHASLNQNIDDYVYFANFSVTKGNHPDSTCR